MNSLLKWENYAVEEVLSKMAKQKELESMDKSDLVNRRIEFLNERLKEVDKKLDRLIEPNKTDTTDVNAVSPREPVPNPFSTMNSILFSMQNTVLDTNVVRIESSMQRDNETDFSTKFEPSPNQKMAFHTTKKVLLNPKSDPDILSR